MRKKSMWMEELPNGKYKFFERYKDPYTEKWKRVSVTLSSGTSRAKKEAQKLLDDKIENVLQKLTTSSALFHTVFSEWWEFHQKQIKLSTYKTMLATYNRILDKVEKGTKDRKYGCPIDSKGMLDTEEWTYTQKYRVKSVLNVFFDYAIDQGFIENNPARKAKLPRRKQSLQQIKNAKDKYLEPKEYKAILKELYRKDITLRYALACEFMILNGCRVGELAGLTLDKYHKETKTLDIHTTFNRYIPDDDGPKTFASFRTTHLTEREIEILDQIIELNRLSESTDKNWFKSDRIFVTNTGKPIHSSILSKSLQRANERLKKPIPKHISPHIFRHTTISILAENKIPLKTIMDRVGHSDSEVTTSIYTHVTKNMKDEAINVLDKVMKNIL